MGVQELLVAVAFVGAVAYLARRAWRSWRGGCYGCGPKPAPPKLIGVEELTARVRR